jgi:hypothetical protein
MSSKMLIFESVGENSFEFERYIAKQMVMQKKQAEALEQAVCLGKNSLSAKVDEEFQDANGVVKEEIIEEQPASLPAIMVASKGYDTCRERYINDKKESIRLEEPPAPGFPQRMAPMVHPPNSYP